MTWTVEATNEFADWYGSLDPDQQDAVEAAVLKLEELGPALARPLADSITASSIHNLKELRPPGGHLRILFVFDPSRSAVLLELLSLRTSAHCPMRSSCV